MRFSREPSIFDSVVNAAPEMMEIPRRARLALQRIAAQSPINARCVAQRGVAVEGTREHRERRRTPSMTALGSTRSLADADDARSSRRSGRSLVERRRIATGPGASSPRTSSPSSPLWPLARVGPVSGRLTIVSEAPRLRLRRSLPCGCPRNG